MLHDVLPDLILPLPAYTNNTDLNFLWKVCPVTYSLSLSTNFQYLELLKLRNIIFSINRRGLKNTVKISFSETAYSKWQK
jgi:hypothetical protein